MTETLRIAHISDPHFGTVTFCPSQFLSKRWLGNTNLLLFRRKAYSTEHLLELPRFLETLGVEAACITGDFSSTSLDLEFESAKEFTDQFNVPLFLLPGNHDAYTKEAVETKLFYHYFKDPELEAFRVSSRAITKGWWWIGLDCSVSTPVFHSYGRFTPAMEEKLIVALEGVPPHHKIIIGNHFPLFDTGKRSHNLKRKEALQEILKRYPQVKLYLHGHDHHPYVIDRTFEKLPLVLNSGSCAPKKHGMFSVLDLNDSGCILKRYHLDKGLSHISWGIIQEKKFEF